MKERFAQVNGIRLHYVDHEGDGPPLVLMHGLSANARSFDALVRAGLGQRFRVLSVDLRGRGQSDKPAKGYSMADHAADILGLLDALGLKQVVLGGHSFGGLLTMYLAAHHPERFSRLLILDAAGSMHPKVRELIKPSLDRLGQIIPSWEVYLAAARKAPFFNGWWDPDIEDYYRADVIIREDGTVKPRSSPEAIAEAVEHALGEDWPRHLAAIRHPVLLLNAPAPCGPPGTPAVLPAEQAKATVEALADCRYVEVPGNHYTMLYGEGARRMAEAIIAFVQGG